MYKKQILLPAKAHIPVNTKHFPTLGNPYAPINITIFEEPSCSACTEFSTEIFPLLKQHYIDKGEASFTLIPVCFIRGSRPVVQALFCIYNHNPRQPDVNAYIEYFHRLLIYPKEEGSHWATPEVIAKLAEGLKTNSGRSINTKGLQQCVASGRYNDQLKKNNLYCSRVLGGQLATPTAIVGDYLVEDPTFDKIEKVIAQIHQLQASEGDGNE
ncbi:disulfide bond chaperone [Candidatus Chlamydia sanziniae]|uniref:Disulfide bond chaperone n=1 Tax=Candidatus Chlamydia sanziniae TaxID=1806891 RepID=A0A1A9HY18_9CHLA|nr:disulfide bond chaperone [Candidatus Chlamydia sanziniae]